MAKSHPWQKSSFSGANGADCVEIAHHASSLLVRESDAPSTVLATTPARLAALIRHTKNRRPG